MSLLWKKGLNMPCITVTKEYLTKYNECLEIIKEDLKTFTTNQPFYAIRILTMTTLAYSDNLRRFYRGIVRNDFKTIGFEILYDRKRYVDLICKKYHLKYLETDYRKSYVRFEIQDDINYFYTYLKLFVAK